MDDFDDWYLEHYGRKPPDYIKTHMRRELVQAVWRLLLDDDFVEAWKSGIKIACGDGILRRVFPRVFTYSADYPEKYDSFEPTLNDPYHLTDASSRA